MSVMLQDCNELISLDLSNFNTSKVSDLQGIFNNCHKLKEIKGINQFNTSNITNMSGMFQACYELISLNLLNFNTSKVNQIQYMFNYGEKLKDLNILNFNIKDNCNITKIINNIPNDCNIKINSKTFKKLFN